MLNSKHDAEEWLEYEFLQPDWVVQLQDDDRYITILLVLCSINEAFRRLYSNGCWLRKADAKCIGELGVRALQGYQKLVAMSLSRGEARFPLHPKFHMLLHTFWSLLWNAKHLEWIESPLTDCCQQCEGFIGHVSRYSRRVSAHATEERTVDLYLVALWKHWETVT